MRVFTIVMLVGLAGAATSEETPRGFGGGAGLIGRYDESTAAGRTEVVFDRNKGALYALYRRALRDNPKLAGKIVFELSIAADGTVTDCVIKSSELHDTGLEQKLVKRILLFRFKPADKPVKIVKFVHFVPAA